MAAGDAELRGKITRVAWEWATGSHPPDPDPGELPAGSPNLREAEVGQARITWIGHATALLRLPGLTVLTDPVFSQRCSPLPFWGPKRFVPPVPSLDDLPQVDAVLLSHDHFDHLDRSSVASLQSRFGEELRWITPLGYRDWFASLGITRVEELDWWAETGILAGYRIVCLPARHWTRRTPFSTNSRLWSGWAILPQEEGAAPRVYFAGDSGYCPAFAEIGRRLGSFDASLIPIGAYEPRWFMKAAHMNPEEAVQAYRDLGAHGLMIPIHWGSWRLTFEDPLEPPERAQTAWGSAGLPEEKLVQLRRGETRTVTASRASPTTSP